MDWISRHRVLATTILISVWGAGFPVVKLGLDYIPPIIFTGLRAGGGGLLLTGIALIYGGSPQLGRYWRIYLTSALFNVALFASLMTLALARLPSGLATVIIYTQPLLVGLIARFWIHEPMGRTKLLGLIVGVAGVGLASLDPGNSAITISGVLLALGSALSWAIGTVYFKSLHESVSMYWFAAIQFLLGGGLLLVLGPTLFGESWRDIEWSGPLWFSLTYTTIIGVTLCWLLWLTLIRLGEATTVSANTFAIPIIAAIVGAFWLGEQLTPQLITGGLLCAAAIRLVNQPLKNPTH
ncbi:MAG: DMT family transporter [Gammaproteobacteria bacterium]|nr:DMT family transporter [Gammaproteobacteria bacterium]